MPNSFEKQITGIFPSKDGNMCFLADGFNFTIMDNQVEPFRLVEIEPRDCFLRGKTRDGYDIGMYAGKKPAHIYGNCHYETGAYVVSLQRGEEGDISYYYGIEFVGGTLNKLLDPDYFRLKEYGQDEIEPIRFSLTVKNTTFQVEIGRSVIYVHSDEAQGNKEKVYCRLYFSDPQHLESFFMHLIAFQELVSFMVYRQNVGFDDVYLLSQPDVINGHLFQNHLAIVYLKYDGPFTERHNYNCIHFDDFGASLATLLTLLYNNEERKPLYSAGFLPKDDLDVYRMSNSKVREICSAIECELYHVQVRDDEVDSNLHNLIDSVKSIIKEHQKSEEKLSDKTYQNIYGSIQNWDISASEKVIALYRKHEQNVVKLRPFHFPMRDTDIEDFIKYRNDITHGRYRILDESIARTGFALIGLFYCCVLSRVGIDEQAIERITNIPDFLGR